VVAEAASTQDAAFDRAAGRAGLMLLAERQTAGRGRLGRAWAQGGDAGLAVTFVLDAARCSAERLSLAAGVAVVEALDGRAPACPAFGLRWPNDAVERGPRGRKVAGVLIEVRGGLALVGVGVNVGHAAGDFPPEVRGRAVSLRELGSHATRLDVAEGLLVAMFWALATETRLLAQEWRRRDVTTGSHRVFIHAGRRVQGIVDSIDPTAEIVVQTAPGVFERLPALTTSLAHEAESGPGAPRGARSCRQR
jgi:BirA family biotin operon repressor/biotin-[acetyl-CoA-carboxylase] ligase